MRVVDRPEINLLSGDLFGETAARAYKWMRAHEPVYHDEANGLWGIATYDGVIAAGRDSATFSNAGGSRPDTGPLPWMIDLDAPDHHKRRKLVSRGFTPARVRDSETRLRAICDDLIDAVCERGTCDIVHDLAAPLPMIVIGDMLGVQPADRAKVLGWSDDMLASLTSAADGLTRAAEGFKAYGEYAEHEIARRRAEPTDDLFSVLVHAEVDGARLSDFEIMFESLLLLIGGDETTRQVTTGGLEQLLLLDPGEREVTVSSVEEMLRWVSPIKTLARTVTSDVEVEGVVLPKGAKLVLLYESANFDDSHFDQPERFDVRRAPNDHLAFGFGPHYCLGASLARLEVRALLERLLTRLPDVALATDEALRRTITGIEHMPVVFSPARRLA